VCVPVRITPFQSCSVTYWPMTSIRAFYGSCVNCLREIRLYAYSKNLIWNIRIVATGSDSGKVQHRISHGKSTKLIQHLQFGRLIYYLFFQRRFIRRIGCIPSSITIIFNEKMEKKKKKRNIAAVAWNVPSQNLAVASEENTETLSR
jgi:hypothetical protein